MENIKLPIALVVAMILQISGGVWWVSQQASTISNLEETVHDLSSRMAIENQVNLERDVAQNKKEIDDLWSEVKMTAGHMVNIVDLEKRVAVLEKEVEFLEKYLDPRGEFRP